MDQQLRTILLIAGLLVVIVVFLLTRRSAKKKGGKGGNSKRLEPSIGSGDKSAGPELAAEDATPAAGGGGESSEVPANTDKIVSIRVAFDAAAGIPLGQVTELFQSAGMRFGQFDIFHYHPTDVPGTAIFSVASMVEPGSFDLSDASTKVPGVTFFMALPGPISAVSAFEKMLDIAQKLISEFGGRLLDESGNKLSVQRIGYLRDEVVSYEHQRRLQL